MIALLAHVRSLPHLHAEDIALAVAALAMVTVLVRRLRRG
jgi:hypothetical protein